MEILKAATQLAQGVVPERYLRAPQILATCQAWDASKDAYVTVETPSKHIAGMCEWIVDRARAVARDAALNKFNPSFVTAKLGAREAAKEDSGLFGVGATGYTPEFVRGLQSDNEALLAALYELRDAQAALEKAHIDALKNAPAPTVVQDDPWAEARAAKKAAKAAKKG